MSISKPEPTVQNRVGTAVFHQGLDWYNTAAQTIDRFRALIEIKVA
ncbi:MAG: hypothetical protein K0U59_11445 [Gammaproteobacteria bacterium]|nr:hypothetical protein [Gammaproteobacteria bacterium]